MSGSPKPTDLHAHAAAFASYLRSSGSDARHAVRVTAGTLVAFLIYHLFNLPQGYWAVFTVVIVMQASIGGTLGASIDRMKGTLTGAVIGGVAAWLRPQTPVGAGVALCLCVALATWLASARPSLKVAPVTAVIMLISPSGSSMGPVDAALFRVVEIAVGSVIGVAATLLIFPARSSALAAARVREALDLMAGLLAGFAEALRGARAPDADILQVQHTAIRTALGAVEAAMGDAARERDSRLGAHAISEAVPRTLWRIRNDGVTAGRALTPFPADLGAKDFDGGLAQPAAALMDGQAAFIRACGSALDARRAVERARQTDGLAAFEQAVNEARASGRTRGLSFDAVGHIFTLVFALESLARNLGDLADRIDEAVPK